MSLVKKLTNWRNIAPEVSMGVGSKGLAFLTGKIAESTGLSSEISSVLIPTMNSGGALVGKLSGFYFCNLDLKAKDFVGFKKDLSKITKIMIPYQMATYLLNSAVLYGLQKGEILDCSDNSLITLGVVTGVDSVCSIGRYFVENKCDILK